VIFDVGGVLVAEKIEPVFKALNKRIGKGVFKKGKLNRAITGGWISEKEFYDVLSRKTRISAKQLLKMTKEEYLKIMHVNKDVLNISRQLTKNGYKIGIISNTSPQHKRINAKRGVFRGFSPKIFSCDVKMLKPETRIYRLLLEKTRMNPNECIVIDDRKEFTDAAKKCGMKSIHFKNAVQLKKDLRKLGVRI
jgi:putative hydrolase of the HAD superfamily